MCASVTLSVGQSISQTGSNLEFCHPRPKSRCLLPLDSYFGSATSTNTIFRTTQNWPLPPSFGSSDFFSSFVSCVASAVFCHNFPISHGNVAFAMLVVHLSMHVTVTNALTVCQLCLGQSVSTHIPNPVAAIETVVHSPAFTFGNSLAGTTGAAATSDRLVRKVGTEWNYKWQGAQLEHLGTRLKLIEYIISIKCGSWTMDRYIWSHLLDHNMGK